MAPWAELSCGLVAGLVILAVALLSLWAIVTRVNAISVSTETFARNETPGLAEHSLGAMAGRLLNRKMRQPTMGAMAASESVSYSTFDAAFYLSVVAADSRSARIDAVDVLVARGAFFSRYFRFVPSDRDILEAKTSSNIRVFQVELEPPETQTFDIIHIAKDEPVDLSLLKGNRSSPITFQGMRITLGSAMRDPMRIASSPSFQTPETLKRNVLEGLTLIVPRAFDRAFVAFRRFRELNGYIVFSVETTEDRVTVRHIVFKRLQPPNDLVNAIQALGWNEAGEYDDGAFFQSVPLVDGGIAHAEAIGADEIRGAMEVATSVTFRMRRRNATIVEVTPGVVRVTSLPVDTRIESRVARVAPVMSSAAETWAPDPVRPLQMYASNAVALPVPTGDHIHLAETIMPNP
jgi:hypothetical protein